MSRTSPIILPFTGGMNNVDTPLQLFLKKQGETQLLVNADTTLNGRLKLLRPLAALNAVAEASGIHTVYRANDKILVGAGANLKYRDGDALTAILSGLTSAHASIIHAGNWAFLGNGTDRKTIYLPTPVGCAWGQDVPSAAPVVVPGAVGSPNGTYSCYYRYKITLPDGSILRTGLSPVASVTVTSDKIEWSGLVHANFIGATSNQIELFRTMTGWSATYLVTTLDAGTTTYSDNNTDATVQANTEFAEDGYYPPPDGINLVVYHPGCDRLFAAVANEIYWSEAGLYHVFVYDETADEYTNVNSVFLTEEDVTGLLMIDEQLYIASKTTWKRLRGTNPSYWAWEPTVANKGPVSAAALVLTRNGAVYPGNDGYIHLFNGFESRRITEHFDFTTDPDSTCHATFDGRFYRLFYGDATYPELVLDFLNYPSTPVKIIQSTRDYSASCYDSMSDTFYVGDDDGYLRSGEDTDEEVTLTFKTCEIMADGTDYGDAGSLVLHANTQGNDLTIIPYHDEEAQDALTAFSSTSLKREARVLPLGSYRALSLQVSITANEDIEIREPWLLRKEGDAE